MIITFITRHRLINDHSTTLCPWWWLTILCVVVFWWSVEDRHKLWCWCWWWYWCQLHWSLWQHIHTVGDHRTLGCQDRRSTQRGRYFTHKLGNRVEKCLCRSEEQTVGKRFDLCPALFFVWSLLLVYCAIENKYSEGCLADRMWKKSNRNASFTCKWCGLKDLKRWSVSDDVAGSYPDVRRPATELRKVSSFTLGDRLRNIIRMKYSSSNEETPANDDTACQRCTQVRSVSSWLIVLVFGLVWLYILLY